MMANMMLDEEEEFNKLCDTCKDKSKENKCSGCGKKAIKDEDVNPQFDDKKFEEMKKRSGGGN